MDWVDRPQLLKDLYGTFQLLQGSHLDNFLLKTLKPDWVAFHSVTFQLKCLDFQSNGGFGSDLLTESAHYLAFFSEFV